MGNPSPEEIERIAAEAARAAAEEAKKHIEDQRGGRLPDGGDRAPW